MRAALAAIVPLLIAPACSEPAERAGTPAATTAASPEAAATAPMEQPVAVGGSGAALSAAPTAAATEAASSWRRVGGTWSPVWFICDAVDAPTVHVVGRPGADGRATIWSYAKPGFAATQREVIVGKGEPGMSQLNYPLTDPADGREIGALRSFNPGVLDRPEGASTPTFSSVRLGDAAATCRWSPGVQALLVTRDRTVQVRRERDGTLTYESYDYAKPGARVDTAVAGATRPSLSMTSGGDRTLPDGSREFAFFNGVYRYVVSVSPSGGGARVMVQQDGRTALDATATAYTVGAPPAGVTSTAP